MDTILEKNSTFGIVRTTNDSEAAEFTALSNFSLEIKFEVDAGPQSGFVADVLFQGGQKLGCAYFTQNDVQEGRERFLAVLSKSLSVFKLSCQATKSQLNLFMRKKLEEYLMRDDCSTIIAASCVGLQPDSDTWVFNKNFQVCLNEEVNKKFIWLGNMYQGKATPHIAPNSLASNAERSVATTVASSNPLNSLIISVEKCYKELTPAVLLTMGSQVLSVHYQSILKIAHQVPATILIMNTWVCIIQVYVVLFTIGKKQKMLSKIKDAKSAAGEKKQKPYQKDCSSTNSDKFIQVVEGLGTTTPTAEHIITDSDELFSDQDFEALDNHQKDTCLSCSNIRDNTSAVLGKPRGEDYGNISENKEEEDACRGSNERMTTLTPGSKWG